MIKVLFVCLGNICRSPMAEAMFRDLIMKEGLEQHFEIDSAGTGNWHVGQPPHEGTRGILKKYNISAEGLKGRKIEAGDFQQFEYIVAMDTSNIENIKKRMEDHTTAKIVKLLDFVEDIDEKDVPDPYYTGDFEQTYDLVKRGCKGLLNAIRTTHHL